MQLSIKLVNQPNNRDRLSLRNSPLRQAGLTLVELLTVFVIMAILLAASMQLAPSWLEQTNAQDIQHKVVSGYEQAKALALRNPCHADSSTATATFRSVQTGSKNYSLEVVLNENNSSNCNYLDKQPNPQWRFNIPVDMAVEKDGAKTFNFELNNRGLPIDGKSLEYTITNKGNIINAIDTLY